MQPAKLVRMSATQKVSVESPLVSFPTCEKGLKDQNVLDLRSVTTTGDADADVEVGELVQADDEEGLVDLCDCA